jgi:hypothetical protein
MAIETLRFALNDAAYVQISDSQANVTIDNTGTGAVYVAVATSLPAPTLTDFKTISQGRNLALGSLGTSKLWAKSSQGSGQIEVIRG